MEDVDGVVREGALVHAACSHCYDNEAALIELLGAADSDSDHPLPTHLTVIHGGQDEVVPIEHGQVLYELAAKLVNRSWGASCKVELRVQPRAKHNDILKKYWNVYLAAILS
eukprot:g48365.t1